MHKNAKSCANIVLFAIALFKVNYNGWKAITLWGPIQKRNECMYKIYAKFKKKIDQEQQI